MTTRNGGKCRIHPPPHANIDFVNVKQKLGEWYPMPKPALLALLLKAMTFCPPSIGSNVACHHPNGGMNSPNSRNITLLAHKKCGLDTELIFKPIGVKA